MSSQSLFAKSTHCSDCYHQNTLVLHIFELNIIEVIEDVLFFFWLISLSPKFVRFIILCFVSTNYANTTIYSFILLLVNAWLISNFSLFTFGIVLHAPYKAFFLYVHVHISVGYIPRCGIAGS